MALVWIVSILASIAGALVIVGALMRAVDSAEVAAGTALGLACAVIPYCIARSLERLLGGQQLEAAAPPEREKSMGASAGAGR